MNLEIIKNKLNLLKKLEYNWDGYKSLSFSDKILNNCYKIVELINNNISAFFLKNLNNNIIPVSSGMSVQLEWIINNKEVEIEIFEDKIEFLKYEHKIVEEGIIDWKDIDKEEKIINIIK
jgi:hypothetical protein